MSNTAPSRHTLGERFLRVVGWEEGASMLDRYSRLYSCWNGHDPVQSVYKQVCISSWKGVSRGRQ